VKNCRLTQVVWICVVALATLFASVRQSAGTGIVSKFAPNGAFLGSFDAGLNADQHFEFVKVDALGNIWVGRSDDSHSINQFNPNDMATKFSPTGTQLLTVKGPMRDPNGIAFDSSGDIYIGGVPDGGRLEATQIFKYDSGGNFLINFGELTGQLLAARWKDLLFTPGDRLFGTTGNPHSVQELTVNGNLVNLVGSFDGTLRFGVSLVLSSDGNTLWNYQPQNGPGQDFIVGYNLSLTVISFFGLNVLGVPNPFLGGLETLSNGDVLTIDRNSGVIYQFAPNGTLLDRVPLSGLGRIWDFTIDGDGNFLVAHTTAASTPAVPEPSTLTLLGIGTLGLFGYRWRRRTRSKEHPC
jgi:hypothetical protein